MCGRPLGFTLSSRTTTRITAPCYVQPVTTTGPKRDPRTPGAVHGNACPVLSPTPHRASAIQHPTLRAAIVRVLLSGVIVAAALARPCRRAPSSAPRRCRQARPASCSGGRCRCHVRLVGHAPTRSSSGLTDRPGWWVARKAHPSSSVAGRGAGSASTRLRPACRRPSRLPSTTPGRRPTALSSRSATRDPSAASCSR